MKPFTAFMLMAVIYVTGAAMIVFGLTQVAKKIEQEGLKKQVEIIWYGKQKHEEKN